MCIRDRYNTDFIIHNRKKNKRIWKKMFHFWLIRSKKKVISRMSSKKEGFDLIMFRFVKCTRLLFFWVVINSLAVQFNLLKGKKSFKQYLQHTDNFVDGSLSLVERRHDFKYVRMRFLALSPNSGNWRWHDMIMALIFSLGCLEIGTRRSKFSSTNRRTNICDLKKKTFHSYKDMFHNIIIKECLKFCAE